jgi:hypothetical protein
VSESGFLYYDLNLNGSLFVTLFEKAFKAFGNLVSLLTNI